MATFGAQSTSSQLRRRWRRMMWLTLAIILTALVGSKAWLQHRYVAIAERERTRYASLDGLRGKLSNLSLAGQSQNSVEAQLAQRGPFTIKNENPENHLREVEFRDAESGFLFVLHFRNDGLYMFSWALPPSSRPNLSLWDAFGRFYRWTWAGAIVAWFVGLLVSLNVWRRHKSFGEAMLVASAVCAVVGLLDDAPGGLFVMSGRPLWVGLGLLVVSGVIALLPDPRVIRRDRCRHCDYDLTGNQSGTCPECGGTIPSVSYDAVAQKLSEMRPSDEVTPPATETFTGHG